jgi:predicted phage terminase large subunit-like protein
MFSRRPKLTGLLDFVPRVTRRFDRPTHLAPVAAILERARLESLRVVISAPPRHGKTELLQHEVPRRLLEDPSLRIGYATYGQRFSAKRSARMRAIAEQVGVPLDGDSASKADWRTGVEDGGCWATSVGGPITGEGFELLLIDDPHKDRATAESAIERDKLYDWFNDTAFTRLEPNGSCIVFMARWHEDDLAGRLIKDGWEHLVLRAIDDNGASLWPSRWPVERLREIQEKLGAYSWASLYLGSPVPRGGQLFRDAYFYDSLPEYFRIGKGIDLAYTAKTRADRSAAVVMLESEDRYYVVDVRTAQVKVPEFLSVLAGVDQSYPGPWHWFSSTTESGLADLASAIDGGVTIEAERAAADKFVRAQPVSAAWNAGKVLLPRNAPWLDQFVSEVCGFSGVGDRRDDQVDALTSAFARVNLGAVSKAKAPHAHTDFTIEHQNVAGGLFEYETGGSFETPLESGPDWLRRVTGG